MTQREERQSGQLGSGPTANWESNYSLFSGRGAEVEVLPPDVLPPSVLAPDVLPSDGLPPGVLAPDMLPSDVLPCASL